MRFEPRRAFSASGPLRRAGMDGRDGSFAPDIAFLVGFGIKPDILRTAERRARREKVSASRSLLAHGDISESCFYRCLADHLDLPFVDGWPHLEAPFDPIAVRRSGRAKLAGDPHWLLAPTEEDLRTLLAAHDHADLRRAGFHLTTPAHFAAIIRHRAEDAIAFAASDWLPSQAPNLSAKGAFEGRSRIVVGALILVAAIAIITGFLMVTCFWGTIFLAGMIFRLMVCAVGLEWRAAPDVRLTDAEAPFYSILVPLRHEAHMIDGLVAALEALDYPKSRLEILILVEADDHATRDALLASARPSYLHVVTVPDGAPRTKPRALNAGLFLARGELLTVYDAEDRPEPDQLRRAAERFKEGPDNLACLQARLRIANGARGLLARGIMEHPPQPLPV